MTKYTDKEFENLISQYGDAEVFPVVTRFPADLLTPFGAYLKLSTEAEYSFLFESVEGGENLARYSFLGANPVQIAKENNSVTKINGLDGETNFDKTVFEYLRKNLYKRSIAKVPNLPSFIGGAVGYFDFSAAQNFEPVLKQSGKDSESDSQSEFAIYKTTIAFDHARQQIAIITLVFSQDAKNRDQLLQLFKNARQTNKDIFGILEASNFPKITSGDSKSEDQISSNWKKEDFKDAVAKIKELINAGECYQVVLSQSFSKRTNASPEAIYRALRSLNPSPYMILMKHEEKSIVGASPEMLIRCRDNKLEYRPIAGTRPRGKNEVEDAQLAEEMRADKKEVAEHTMLVDLGRNDLGRVSKYGSVKVKNFLSVEKFSHVQHLVSYLFPT